MLLPLCHSTVYASKDNKKNYPANVGINDTISYIFIIKHTGMIIEVTHFIEY